MFVDYNAPDWREQYARRQAEIQREDAETRQKLDKLARLAFKLTTRGMSPALEKSLTHTWIRD